jgi:peroxidase
MMIFGPVALTLEPKTIGLGSPSETANDLWDSFKIPTVDALKASAGSQSLTKEIKKLEKEVRKSVVLSKEQIKDIKIKAEKMVNASSMCKSFNITVSGRGFPILHENGLCMPWVRRPPCNARSPYRTIDGSCNNLEDPMAGAANTRFRRLVYPVYNDGFGEPKIRGRDLQPLKSAREVSIEVTPAMAKPVDRKLSNMAFRWGQYLDHDISFTPENEEESTENGHSVDVCVANSHRFPIPIPKNDSYFDPKKRTCIPFLRSLGTFFTDTDSHLSKKGLFREQLNDITAYIDASNVYSSSAANLKLLRVPSSALLKVSGTKDHPLLPHRNAGESGCVMKAKACYRAGDIRVNENPGLGAMHTTWVRYHNLIAAKLAVINPHWDNELIFQQTRRIIGAVNQHITYKEFLPLILGKKTMRRWGLKIRRRRHARTYDPKCSATVSNVFATAAYRFGHSFIGNDLFVSLPGRNEKVDLVSNFGDPSTLLNAGFVGGYLKGDSRNGCEKMDRFFSTAVHDRLFETNQTRRDGLDLVSLNIQRGRDHGLPGYTTYLRYCRIKPPNRFRDLRKVMSGAAIKALEKVYK